MIPEKSHMPTKVIFVRAILPMSYFILSERGFTGEEFTTKSAYMYIYFIYGLLAEKYYLFLNNR
jgi:hypothetical protein